MGIISNTFTRLNHINNKIDNWVLNIPVSKLNLYSYIFIAILALVVGNLSGLFLEASMFDEDFFGELGRHFSEHNNFNGTLRRAPIYPLFLGVIIKLFGYSNYVFIFFQSFILAGLGVVSYYVTLKIIKSWKASLITGILVVIHPMNFLYVSKLMVELPFALLFLLMIWFAYRSISRSKNVDYIAFGIFAGLSALCKSVTLLYPLFFFCCVLLLILFKIENFRSISKISMLKLLVIPMFFMMITLSPWTIRNYINTDSIILVSKGAGFEFLRGDYLAQENAFLNLKQTNEEIWEKFSVEYEEILSRNNAHTSAEANKVLDERMKTEILSNPQKFIIKILKQIPAFWYRGGSLAKSLIFLVFAIPILIISLIGFFKSKNTSMMGYVVAASVIYFNLIYASILAIARYSMPLYTPMIILAVMGMHAIFKRKSEKYNNA